MSIDNSDSLAGYSLQNLFAKQANDLPLSQKRPPVPECRIRNSTTNGGAGISDFVQKDIGRGQIVQFVQRSGDRHDRFTNLMLRRNEVSASDTVAAQNWPGMVENVKNRAS